MNHQLSLAIDSDILGDGGLQERFAAYVEILGRFVLHVRRPVDLAQAAEMSDVPVSVMKRYFHELASVGILEKLRGVPGAWRLLKDPREITLEDVFRCAVAANARRRQGRAARPAAASQDTELLLMQALLTVDAHLYKSLRAFSLDCLMACGAARLPARRCRSVPPFEEVD